MSDFNRLRKSLAQLIRGEDMARAEHAATTAIQFSELCGDFSKSRQMLFRIGKAILLKTPATVLVPVCLDYGNLDGSVPPVALRHLAHLQSLTEVLPELTATLLMPDTEAKDPALLRATGLSTQEFEDRIEASRQALLTEVASGVCVKSMLSVIPDLMEREAQEYAWIAGESSFRIRIQNDTLHRSDLYDRTMRGSSFEERVERTIKTAAQYVALGRFAAIGSFLLMNHTTTNLAWYGNTEAGVLHNPVELLDA